MDTIGQTKGKSSANQPSKAEETLNSLAEKSETVLFKAEAVFPFDFFPDEIIVDLNKVSIIYKQFFFAEQLYPVLIRNIEGVVVESSVLFSTLRIEVVRFLDEPVPIHYLKTGEAYKAKRIIMGLIACNKEGIDPATVSLSELMGKVETIGSS